MPYTLNGVGTWYYGKKNLLRREGVCEVCNNLVMLESYDTTLYFVVVFIPVIPLGRKRVLNECSYCTRHRVLSLHDWEARKASAVAETLARLRADPNSKEVIIEALQVAMSFQDRELFGKLAASLAQDLWDDATIQAQLGRGYTYFDQEHAAEAAYRASLAAEDNPEIRRQLALNLIDQGFPREADPFLRHILDERLAEHAGVIFLLVQEYQRKRLHAEALELMDQRDAAFPDLAGDPTWKKQRARSEKRLLSTTEGGSGLRTAGGKESSRKAALATWTARLIIPAILLGAALFYLGIAWGFGQARKVYLVNGWEQPYTVAVNGEIRTLVPGQAMAVRVTEGVIAIEFRNPKVSLPPVSCTVETFFWTRPIWSPTFVINPDQLAILAVEQATYDQAPAPDTAPARSHIHLGKLLHTFWDIDYEFAPFPKGIYAKGNEPIRKKRVDFVPRLTSISRLALLDQEPADEERRAYARRWLGLEPDDPYFLPWFLNQVPEDEALEFLRPGLAVRPLRVEWHRAYQDLLGRTSAEQDLRPEYRRLVAELPEDADAVYLLGRTESVEEADRLFRQAAESKPPSVYAIHAVGYDALARGQFAEGITWIEKAVQLAPTNPLPRSTLESALLAAGQYDQLLVELGKRPPAPGGVLRTALDRVRIHVAQGDPDKARTQIRDALSPLPLGADSAFRQTIRAALESTFCCASGDVEGYLKVISGSSSSPGFFAALLSNKPRDAASSVTVQGHDQPSEQHALLYLAALKSGDDKLRDEQWPLLERSLKRADRHSRRLGDMLAGRQPLNADLIRRLPIDPRQKRVLLVVVAKRQPDLAKELLPLAQALDFHRDEVSLCLRALSD